MDPQTAVEPAAPRRVVERTLCIYAMTLSAQLLGVSLTGIGLLRVAASLRPFETWADDLLVGAALLFLSCCILSYAAFRSTNPATVARIERAVDILLLGGLCLMAIVAGVITYAVA